MAKKVSQHASSKEVDDGKACAILAYLLIGIIWYFVDDKMKKNSFVRHHVQQGIVLLVGSLVYSIALSILFAIIAVPIMFMGGPGVMIMGVLSLLFWIPMIWAIIGIVRAAQGSMADLPVIGHFGKKLKI